jgi:putative DNA primase/helicase
MAERFVSVYGGDWRYIHDTRLWLVFRNEDQRWRTVEPGEPTRLAIENARAFLDEARRIRDKAPRKAAISFGKACQNESAIKRVLRIIQDLEPVATTSDEWNVDPWLVGVPNGIIDLRTGKLVESGREHLISLSLGAPFDPRATCPRWEQFLHEIFRDEKNPFQEQALVKYIQRVLGYLLTGLVTEQTWWLLFGEGSNGKSTLLNIIAYILASYGKTVSFRMFEEGRNRLSVGDGTETLVHMRFVSAREAIEGLPLDSERLKAFTGGDPLPTRGLYQAASEFEPDLKLFLCANHKPKVKDDSFGFWRRVHVVVFPHCFSGDAKEDGLEAKLKAEATGILAWMVRGCLEWQGKGLVPPATVKRATAEYQSESDQIAEFISERCEEVSGAGTGAAAMYDAYSVWAFNRGIRGPDLLSGTAFGTRMKKRFSAEHRKSGNVYLGVRVNPVTGPM